MSSNNIFKKYIGADIVINKNTLSEFKSDIYVPPSKRNINHITVSSEKSNIFINSLKESSIKQKNKSKPLYRVTEEKLQSFEVFPELIKNHNNKKVEEVKQWVIKKENMNEESKEQEVTNDESKLYVPDGWLLLSDLNKGKTISQIEKERDERYYYKQLQQYYADMKYLMEERNAIKRKLYVSVGDYFGYDSIILRDLPLKLDFLNESDNELDDENSDNEDYKSNLESEDDYDEEARI